MDNNLAPIVSLYADVLMGEAGVPSAIGAFILSAVFPSDGGVPSYFDEVYQQIAKIVAQEITTSDIDLIEGDLNGVVSFVREEYKNLKDDKTTTKAQLADAIAPRARTLYDVIGKLSVDDYRKPGLRVFLLAGSVHLSLLQEQALNDPNHDDPYQSSYATTIKQRAQDYADQVEADWPRVMTDRRNAIIVAELHESRPGGPPDYEPIYYSNYQWRDSVTGEAGPETTEPDAQSQAADRQNGKVAELRADLGNPENVVASWRVLQKDPFASLPSKKAKILSASYHVVVSNLGIVSRWVRTDVSWSTDGAVRVLIDNQPVATSGSMSINGNNTPLGAEAASGLRGAYGTPDSIVAYDDANHFVTGSFSGN